jgi:AraC-like DNA-binding protein
MYLTLQPLRASGLVLLELVAYDLSVAGFTEGRWFRRITPGIETVRSSSSLPRHRHFNAYASIVLAGTFEESGYSGRIRATVGDVLIHAVLDCHANRVVVAGLKLLRLEWHDLSGAGGFYRLDNVDEVARTAEKDVNEASLLLESCLRRKKVPSPGRRNDWPDLLLADLATNTATEISQWAESNGLARETVSRGFAAAYGIAPSTLRAELRARAAWLRLTRGSEPLCQIAIETGFSDQAHMTRWVRRITGAQPGAWRPNHDEHKRFMVNGIGKDRSATTCVLSSMSSS